MKRVLSSVIFAGVAVFGFAAQGSFTIVRPFDGSKVREVVKVLFPVASIPENTGYVGIFIDGEFVEALSPKLSKDKKYYEYTLDTKAYEDGTHKLEAKLYVDYSNQPRIVDTSSVDITIANKSSIAVPEDGFKLRYKFATGTERIYRLQQRTITNAISEDDQKKQGSRPFQIQEEGETLKMLYSVDNAYNNGDGLVRMQIVPDKGVKNREFSYVSTANSDTPKKYTPDNMGAIYMRITNTGREVFGTIPDYFGLEGNTGTGSRFGLFAAFPLPTLPTKGVRPGDSWQTAVQRGSIGDKLNSDKRYTTSSVVNKLTARGELLGVEWEMGHPCAKIRNSIAIGTPGLNSKGASEIADGKISMEETVWFALDTGVVIKFFQDVTIEGKMDFGLAGGSSGASAGGGGGSTGAVGPGGLPGGKGGPTSAGGRGADDFSVRSRPQGATPGNKGGPPPGSRPGMGAPMGIGAGQGAAPAGFGNSGQTAFVKRRMQLLFILEK